MAQAKPRKNRAPLNLAMGLAGLVGIIALFANIAMDGPMAINVVVVISLLVSLTTMFVTRRSDEYTLALWSSGANAAFAVIVVWLFFAPFIEGVYDGFMSVRADASTEMDLPTEGASAASILAFYVVFNIKRLTGAL